MKAVIIAATVLLAVSWLSSQARFTDNGDGTVSDNGTGLVWQKCSRGQDATTCSGTATTANWQTALQYCRNLTLDDRSWRLPSVNELGSIVDYSVENPSINTAFFPNTESLYYWSSTTWGDSKTHAWEFYFYLGIISGNVKTADDYVRCVADGP